MRRALHVAVLSAFTAIALTGCPGGAVGDRCEDDDCRDDLVCDPATLTCVELPSSTDAAPGTDATSSSTDAVPGSDSGSPGTDAVVGADGGGAVFTPCTKNGDCAPTWECQIPLCPMGATVGFCYDPSWNTFCGGLAGIACPAGGLTTCFYHGSCVDDAGGVCLTPAQQAAICAAQPTTWGCP